MAWAAQPPAPGFTWNAPDGCPTAAMVLGNVERILANTARGDAPVVATVNVNGTPGQPWQANLSLEIDGRQTERRFEAESCDAIAAATALIIAVAAEEGAALGETFPAGLGPEPPTEPPSTSAQTPEQDDDFEAAPPPGFLPLVVAMGALFDFGTLPNRPATGLEASAGQRWSGPWRPRLLLGTSFFLSQRSAYGSLTGVNLWLLNVSARACFGAAFSHFEIGPCLGADVAIMHSSGLGVDTGIESARFRVWPSPVVSALASWDYPGIPCVVLRAEVVAPLGQSSITVDRDGDKGKSPFPAIALRVALGFEFHFE